MIDYLLKQQTEVELEAMLESRFSHGPGLRVGMQD